MKKCDQGDPIVYSSNIEEILAFFAGCSDKFNECRQYMDQANNETQDILHTMELCTCTAQERNKLFNSLSTIRRKRRVCKNEEAVLSPIIDWIRMNQRSISTLQSLLENLKTVETSVNGKKFYRSRSDVIKNILGQDSILDIPPDVPDCLKDDQDPMEKTNHERPHIISIDTFDSISDARLKEGRELKTLFYPVIICHSKNKRSGVYYYAFPGVEFPLTAHTFYSGDPVLNVRNKKLLHDINTTFHEVMRRNEKDIPYPIPTIPLHLKGICEQLNLQSISEVKQIYQEYKCYCDVVDSNESEAVV